MSTFISIAEGINLLSGRAREEYAEFVAGWLCFHASFAKYLNQSFDENVCETYEGASATDFLGSIKAAGWKPRRGESMRDFDARIKALPIFTQLGLVDGGVDVIKDGDTSTLDPDFIKSDESPVTDADTRDALALLQELYDEHQECEARFSLGHRRRSAVPINRYPSQH
jgi:hypothetical protein